MDQALQDASGRRLILGDVIGKGGEGVVHRLVGSPGLVVKTYHKAMDADRVRKVQVLANWADTTVDRFIARPRGLVLTASGEPRGLILPMVKEATDVHEAYSTKSLKSKFPKATWALLVRFATNLSRAVAAVHEQGLVIGDVNHGSVMVKPDGTVVLIDVDSFQVPGPGGRPFLCTVAVPDYTPPEMVGKDPARTVRTMQHDAFGLAVLIFQLLALGRHPFAGTFDAGHVPFETAIMNGWFAFSRTPIVLPSGRPAVAPPRGAITLDDLPAEIGDGFDRAFREHVRGRRPDAHEWVALLEDLERDLQKCGRSSMHQYAPAASSCPWCRIERTTGKALFGQPIAAGPEASPRQSVSTADLEHRRLSALFRTLSIPAVGATPAETPRPPLPGHLVRAARRHRVTSWATGAAGPAVTGSVAASGSPHVVVAVVGAVALFVFLAVSIVRARFKRSYVLALREAAAAYTRVLTDHRRLVAFPASTAQRQKAQGLLSSWSELPKKAEAQAAKIHSAARRAHVEALLRSRPVTLGSASGIGEVLVGTLHQHGIRTAADVTAARVGKVPGFGPGRVKAMVDWRASLEKYLLRKHPYVPGPGEAAALARSLVEAKVAANAALAEALRELERVISGEVQAVSAARAALVEADRCLRSSESAVVAVGASRKR